MNTPNLLSRGLVLVFAILTFNQLACHNASFEAVGPNNQGQNILQPRGGDLTDGANEIHYFGNDDPIYWSSDEDNIYKDGVDDCIIGLSQSADDDQVERRIQQLAAILSRSQVGRGSRDEPAAGSRYLVIYYTNGDRRVFNLNSNHASQNEEYLSNGNEVIAFYDQIGADLEAYGQRSCPYGKGDK